MNGETINGVEIEQQTKDELQLPCDSHAFHFAEYIPCAKPAEWIARTICPSCGVRPPNLICPKHLGDLAAGTQLCRPCRLAGTEAFRALISVEPLR